MWGTETNGYEMKGCMMLTEKTSRRRRRRGDTTDGPVCQVIPPNSLLYAPVDFTSGGKFLREIDRFLGLYYAGQSVLGRFRPEKSRQPAAVTEAVAVQKVEESLELEASL